ncbi:unnamed protein product [Penicillium nalgiovense]|nr:unnamed protein product [Penicillium nalgiovense]
MVNRKEDQGLAAIEKIKEEAGNDAMIEWILCDMGNLEQIRQTFTKFREQEERLDIVSCSFRRNQRKPVGRDDRISSGISGNLLGQFYVCNQLFPLLRKTSKLPDTPAPRIVFESSEQHRMAPSDVHLASLDEISNSKVGNLQLYCRTKLAISLGVKYGLLERVIRPNNDNIYTLSVHPGAVGCFSALYAATSPEIVEKDWNGYYFTDPGQPAKESSQASDPGLGSALWYLSELIIKDRLGQGALVDWGPKV